MESPITLLDRKQVRRLTEAREWANTTLEHAFTWLVKCIKNDFKDISTFYRGSKSDCKFNFLLSIDV